MPTWSSKSNRATSPFHSHCRETWNRRPSVRPFPCQQGHRHHCSSSPLRCLLCVANFLHLPLIYIQNGRFYICGTALTSIRKCDTVPKLEQALDSVVPHLRIVVIPSHLNRLLKNFLQTYRFLGPQHHSIRSAALEQPSIIIGMPIIIITWNP